MTAAAAPSVVPLIGVLDVAGGRCVHADGGQRRTYRPLGAVFGGSSQPMDVANRLLRRGARSLYLADLDALTGRPVQAAVIREVADRLVTDTTAADVTAAGTTAADERRLLVDAGREPVPSHPAIDRIVSLESLPQPSDLPQPAAGDVFSLDLRAGRPLAGPGWPRDPLAIAACAIDRGFARMLVLDVAVVGGRGLATTSLLAKLKARFPQVELLAGGGVRSPADVKTLARAGAAAVLVGTALHRGDIGSARPAARRD